MAGEIEIGFDPLNKDRFERVGLVGRQDSELVIESLHSVLRVLSDAHCNVAVEKQTADMLDGVVNSIAREQLAECDLAVVVGGDGSILGVARELAHTDIPVVGVNRGGLGFLADISPDQIQHGLRDILQGKYRTEVHFLLTHDVFREEKVVHTAVALNDIVVNSGSITRMMDFSVYIDSEFVYDQRSDGLIVSTPTGSTAYSLSAGGPIMVPGLDALALVPMFPHTLSSRPLVVPGSSEISIILGESADTALVSADSQVTFTLHPNDEVRIHKYPHGVNIAYRKTHNFFEACRRKLDWASRLGNR